MCNELRLRAHLLFRSSYFLNYTSELTFAQKTELCALVAALEPAYMEEVIALIHASM